MRPAAPVPLDDPRADLLRRWRALLAAPPRLPRARDGAESLGVSEGALTEARRLGGEAVALRRPDGPQGFGLLLEGLGGVGEVMALTRNDHCVHEKHGVYAAPSFHGAMGQTLGEIDLRLFLGHWAAAYALVEETRSGRRRSLQVFDGHGEAVHKVYATAATDAAAWERLVDAHAAPDAAPAAFSPAPPPEAERPDADIDADGLRAGWAALEHSHDFFGLLRRFGAGRAQAMRLGAPAFTRPLAPEAARLALERAAADGVPLMIFVGNRGCVQIHGGPVHRIGPMGPWINVLDPRFNLHLRTDRTAGAWAVRKPSLRGDVHSVELFDADGFCFVQIFGERPPGEAERADWRALVAALPEAAPC
jgi:putative hemin transport protein